MAVFDIWIYFPVIISWRWTSFFNGEGVVVCFSVKAWELEKFINHCILTEGFKKALPLSTSPCRCRTKNLMVTIMENIFS